MKKTHSLYKTRKVRECEIKTFTSYAAYLRWREDQYEQLKVFDVKEYTRHDKKD